MIFPRNRVAHLDVLEQYGCMGFRGSRPVRSRAASLISELQLRTKSHPAATASGSLIEIPPGEFINWRAGARRAIPCSITRLRARAILAHAARTGGVAHFWLHPENIASHPATLRNFRAIVEAVASARDAGAIKVRTQIGYCVEVSRALESRCGLSRDRRNA